MMHLCAKILIVIIVFIPVLSNSFLGNLENSSNFSNHLSCLYQTNESDILFPYSIFSCKPNNCESFYEPGEKSFHSIVLLRGLTNNVY